MNIFRYLCFLFIFNFCILIPIEAQAALVVKNLRYSTSAEKVRIVLDINEDIKLKAEEGFSDNIVLNFKKGKIDKKLKDIEIKLDDPFIKESTLVDISRDNIKFDILLNKETKYKIFLLKNPWRVVIDVFKEYDIDYASEIKPGIKYVLNKTMKNGIPAVAHYLVLDQKNWTIKPMIANNEVLTRSKLKNIVSMNEAIAGINASYFALDGWVIGNLKVNGEVVGMESMNRTALLFYENNQYEITPITYNGKVTLPSGESFLVKGVNRGRLADDLVLYKSSYIKNTKTNSYGREIIIDNKGKVVDINLEGNSSVANGNTVISTHGEIADSFADVSIGDKIKITQTMGSKADKALHVLGAGPRLIENGKVIAEGNTENFLPDIIKGRAPRTALGFTENNELVLCVVDGRSDLSSGMTLVELAYALKKFGVVEAMNLDGGGSSEMVINDEVVSTPSGGSERPITVAIGVFAH